MAARRSSTVEMTCPDLLRLPKAAWSGAAAESTGTAATTKPRTRRLVKLGLLIRSQDLVESGVGFRVAGGELRSQRSDRGGSPVDAGAVVGFHSVAKTLLRGSEVVVQRGRGSGGIRENRGGLLLLSGGQRKLPGQEPDAPLRQVRGRRRIARALREHKSSGECAS